MERESFYRGWASCREQNSPNLSRLRSRGHSEKAGISCDAFQGPNRNIWRALRRIGTIAAGTSCATYNSECGGL